MSFKIRRTSQQIKFKQPSMTEQAHKAECDIHGILNKHKKTGILSHVAQYKGEYSNMIDAPDFHEMQNIIADAKTMFESVPSHIRKEFNNDAGQYLEFMQNPDNVEKIQQYGLDASHLLVVHEETTEEQADIFANKIASAIGKEPSPPE